MLKEVSSPHAAASPLMAMLNMNPANGQSLPEGVDVDSPFAALLQNLQAVMQADTPEGEGVSAELSQLMNNLGSESEPVDIAALLKMELSVSQGPQAMPMAALAAGKDFNASAEHPFASMLNLDSEAFAGMSMAELQDSAQQQGLSLGQMIKTELGIDTGAVNQQQSMAGVAVEASQAEPVSTPVVNEEASEADQALADIESAVESAIASEVAASEPSQLEAEPAVAPVINEETPDADQALADIESAVESVIASEVAVSEPSQLEAEPAVAPVINEETPDADQALADIESAVESVIASEAVASEPSQLEAAPAVAPVINEEIPDADQALADVESAVESAVESVIASEVAVSEPSQLEAESAVEPVINEEASEADQVLVETESAVTSMDSPQLASAEQNTPEVSEQVVAQVELESFTEVAEETVSFASTSGAVNTSFATMSGGAQTQTQAQMAMSSDGSRTAANPMAQMMSGQAGADSGQQSFQSGTQQNQNQAQQLAASIRAANQGAATAEADAVEEADFASLLTSERRPALPNSMQTIPVPIKHPQWGQALGQRVVYMANANVQQAQITLNPEKLGPIQIKLHMDRDQQMQVSMVAQHGTTKEALEQAVPRLREMLEQAGISIANVDVEQESSFASQYDGQDGESEASSKTASSASPDELDNNDTVATTQTIASDNVVDYYV